MARTSRGGGPVGKTSCPEKHRRSEQPGLPPLCTAQVTPRWAGAAHRVATCSSRSAQHQLWAGHTSSCSLLLQALCLLPPLLFLLIYNQICQSKESNVAAVQTLLHANDGKEETGC